MEQNKIKLVSK